MTYDVCIDGKLTTLTWLKHEAGHHVYDDADGGLHIFQSRLRVGDKVWSGDRAYEVVGKRMLKWVEA